MSKKDKKISTHEINMNTKVSIEHLNVRKMGEENDELAVDIKVSGFIEKEMISVLMGVHVTEIEYLLWDIAEKDNPSKLIGVDDISCWAVFEDIEVVIAGVLFDLAKLHKFKIKPVGGMKAACTFTVTSDNLVSENEIGLIASKLKQVSYLKANKKQKELPLGSAA